MNKSLKVLMLAGLVQGIMANAAQQSDVQKPNLLKTACRIGSYGVVGALAPVGRQMASNYFNPTRFFVPSVFNKEAMLLCGAGGVVVGGYRNRKEIADAAALIKKNANFTTIKDNISQLGGSFALGYTTVSLLGARLIPNEFVTPVAIIAGVALGLNTLHGAITNEQKVDALTGQISTQARKITELNAQIANLSTQNGSLGANNKSNENEIARLTAEKTKVEIAKEVIQAELNNLSVAKGLLEGTVKEKSLQIVDLNARLTRQDKTIVNLMDANGKLVGANEVLVIQNKYLEEEVSNKIDGIQGIQLAMAVMMFESQAANGALQCKNADENSPEVQRVLASNKNLDSVRAILLENKSIKDVKNLEQKLGITFSSAPRLGALSAASSSRPKSPIIGSAFSITKMPSDDSSTVVVATSPAVSRKSLPLATGKNAHPSPTGSVVIDNTK